MRQYLPLCLCLALATAPAVGAAELPTNNLKRAAELPNKVLVAAAANTNGFGDTQWRTELAIHNPWPGDAAVELVFLPEGSDNSAATAISMVIPKENTIRLSDVIAETFQAPGAKGAIMVASQRTLMVSSRTANHTELGTYGQSIPGRPLGAGESEATLLMLERSEQRRTNLGFVNPGLDAVELEVAIRDERGELLDSFEFELPAFGFRQFSDALAEVGDVPKAYATVHSLSGAPVFSYASVIESDTGDAVFVRPARIHDQRMIVPVVARSTGLEGTSWSSDLEIYNPSAAAITVRAEFIRAKGTGFEPIDLEVAGHSLLRLTDVVWELGGQGNGSISLEPNGPIAASSRTFNTTQAGRYGQMVEVLPASELIERSKGVELVHLSTNADRESGFRTNVGVFSDSPRPIIVDLMLFSSTGSFLAAQAVHVEPGQLIQRNDLLAEFEGKAPDGAWIVARSVNFDSRFAIFASVVDNRTGDAVYQSPYPIPTARTAATSSASHGAR